VGVPTVGVEIRAVDESGVEIPWDGTTKGELQVRGMWVSGSLYGDPRSADKVSDGWFCTGDIATIDAGGYVGIVDRTKDVIKSGGEWISSIELESIIMNHPKVLEAAVIAMPHPTWQERPLAAIVLHPQYEGQVTKEEILSFLSSRVAKWWLPEEVIFIDALPKTSVGKFDKKALRERYARNKQASA
jgi:fatty-acyl-CoA synthase